jgi:hypothetical protein
LPCTAAKRRKRPPGSWPSTWPIAWRCWNF